MDQTKLALRIGIDIGGTFTDFVIYDPQTGEVETFKLPSTPASPADAVLSGLSRLLSRYGEPANQPLVLDIVHGSTVATNALLERKGVKTALITTQGFRDVLEIRRQNRPRLYDFFADPPAPLVPRALRFEVNERVDNHGNVLIQLDSADIEAVIEAIRLSGDVKSVAICLLFSFLHPEHEQQIGDSFINKGFEVSLSSQVLPEFREYERTSTTVVNAYVSPVLKYYLHHLQEKMSSLPARNSLRIMQSNGGSISVKEAMQNGVRCILSGPAGGVVGAQYFGSQAIGDSNQPTQLITFDMGGTSTDVSLVSGAPKITTESIIGGCPIRIPVLDIHTIGAGGGSIAWLDDGGALHVGPASAGADPGPACYGAGWQPTVTDANLLLGRLPANHFLGGTMSLQTDRALESIKVLGDRLGLDAQSTALGIIEVINANMERALRLISVERGFDPQDFTLLSFGGAGGLHASELARSLGIPRIMIPPYASTLSAFGMLASNLIKDYSLTVMMPGDTPLGQINLAFAPLVNKGLCEMQEEGISPQEICLEHSLDVRYRGQSYELTIPLREDVLTDFHAYHQATYGYHRINTAVEIVNLRLRAIGSLPSPQILPLPENIHKDPGASLIEYQPVTLYTGRINLPLYRGESLLHGNELWGPALVVRKDTTILLDSGDVGTLDRYGNLWIQVTQ